MEKIWLTYTILTVMYIIVLILYFWRRSIRHEHEVTEVLEQAKKQLDTHRQRIHQQGTYRLTKMMQILSMFQKIAVDFETAIKEEHDKMISKAQDQSKKLIDEAKVEADKIRADVNQNLDGYRQQRQQEIEADLVKLVVSVTEKVVQQRLLYQDHINLIHQALEEVKHQKQKM